MIKEPDEVAYKAYCKDKLLVSEETTEEHADDSIQEVTEDELKNTKKTKKNTTLFIR